MLVKMPRTDEGHVLVNPETITYCHSLERASTRILFAGGPLDEPDHADVALSLDTVLKRINVGRTPPGAPPRGTIAFRYYRCDGCGTVEAPRQVEAGDDPGPPEGDGGCRCYGGPRWRRGTWTIDRAGA